MPDEFVRYLARTEAWAREVTDDTEDVVTSTGRATAYRGDYIVNQKLRGEDFTYVMTADDFADDWVNAEDKNTDKATSETGTDPLPETVPPEPDSGESTTGDNPVEPPASTATGGQRAEPTPADAPDNAGDVTPQSPETAPEGGTSDNAAPTPTASAPTSTPTPGAPEAPSDGGGGVDTAPPNVGADTPDAASPVSGTDTPPLAPPSPEGSAASESTAVDPPAVETTPPGEPDTSTPTQTVDPTASPELPDGPTVTTEDGGGDSGNAPTPNVDNTDAVNTGNADGTVVTSDTADGKHEDPATATDTTPADSTPPDASEAVPVDVAVPPDEGKVKTIPAKRANGSDKTP